MHTLRLPLGGLVLGTLWFAGCDPSQSPLSPSPPIQSVSPPPGPPVAGPAPPHNPGTYSLEGVYTLELNIGSGCPMVPEEQRARRYTATINYATAGRYLVTLTDSTFLTGPICTFGPGLYSGVGCDQFLASEDIDTASFFLHNNNDDAHGGHIVERVSPGGWVEIIGGASGKFDRSSIDATGASSVWYCPTSSNYPFPCFDFVSCKSDDMRMTFRRKSPH